MKKVKGMIYNIVEEENQIGTKRYFMMIEVEDLKEISKLSLGECEVIQR